MPVGVIGPLTINSLSFGGNGVTRHDGRAIFVRGAVPGDVVDVRLTRDKKRYAEAEVVEIRQLSPQRCDAPCPVFGECGGCQWQMLPYSEQVVQKQRIFSDILQRHCNVSAELVMPLLEAPVAWNYRSRVQFKCRSGKTDRLLVGFFRPSSHDVVDIDSCPLVDPAINALLPRVRQLFDSTPFASQVSQIDMEKGDTAQIRILIHFKGKDVDGLVQQLEPLRQDDHISLFIKGREKSGYQHISGVEHLEIEVDAPPLTLKYSAGGFAQVNLEQNRRMVAEALRLLDPQMDQIFLDLYCGMGNFSLPLARRVRKVVGVEDFRASVDQAKKNAERNNLPNTRFVARPARGAIKEMADAKLDAVLLDPPRAGARDVVAELLDARPHRVLYVSCDPMTLARDLKVLLQGGYEMISARPVDMFPQTYHIESLSLLEWRG